MKAEYEVKFLEIDVMRLQKLLREKGGYRVFARKLSRRLIFENAVTRSSKSWIRLRDEGGDVTLTWKRVADPSTIHGVREIEVHVREFELLGTLLEQIGMERINYQENYRERWQLDDIVFDFDTWPGIPTFVEIEGASEEQVKAAAVALGLNHDLAYFGSIDHIYRTRYHRDILKEPRLVFDRPSAG